MLRFHLMILMPMIFILPYTTSAFFLQNIVNITVPRSIRCYMTNNSTFNGYQLCAIRVYHSSIGTQQVTYTTYNGLRYMNTFRRLTGNGCNNLVNVSSAGTGVWICDKPLPIEKYSIMNVCVCATDNCNQNYTLCQSSAENTTNLTGSVDIMPNITSIVSCNDTSNGTDTCNIHPFINVSSCLDYIRNNSVLCTITISGTSTTRRSLIGEMYETYLAENIYYAKSSTTTSDRNWLNETEVSIYLKYQDASATLIEDCICISPLCNQNIDTCASLGTTITTTSTTTTTTSTTSSSSSSSSSSSTSCTTSSSSTTSTSSSTSSVTSTTSTATIKITGANSVRTGGEKGLGSAATAGLACGIIFSVLIFTGEIIFFKFYYSTKPSTGLERSAAYRT